MQKYFTLFQLSWENEFVYRLNFILWRLRNMLRFLMVFFLWKGIFSSNASVFGYSQPQIITYVFLVLALQSLILSAPSADNIGGEIGNGDLSNYLVKPVGYLKYWFTRDMASKILNIFFSFGELFVVWLIFRPSLTLPTSPASFFGFLIAAAFALMIYYLLSAAARFLAFWTPENTWGVAFLILVFTEILAGGIFPLNILPKWAYISLQFTPFPYFAYFPIAIFTGKIVGLEMLRILVQSGFWFVLTYWMTKILWKKGIIAYQASGR